MWTLNIAVCFFLKKGSQIFEPGTADYCDTFASLIIMTLLVLFIFNRSFNCVNDLWRSSGVRVITDIIIGVFALIHLFDLNK